MKLLPLHRWLAACLLSIALPAAASESVIDHLAAYATSESADLVITAAAMQTIALEPTPTPLAGQPLTDYAEAMAAAKIGITLHAGTLTVWHQSIDHFPGMTLELYPVEILVAPIPQHRPTMLFEPYHGAADFDLFSQDQPRLMELDTVIEAAEAALDPVALGIDYDGYTVNTFDRLLRWRTTAAGHAMLREFLVELEASSSAPFVISLFPAPEAWDDLADGPRTRSEMEAISGLPVANLIMVPHIRTGHLAGHQRRLVRELQRTATGVNPDIDIISSGLSILAQGGPVADGQYAIDLRLDWRKYDQPESATVATAVGQRLFALDQTASANASVERHLVLAPGEGELITLGTRRLVLRLDP